MLLLQDVWGYLKAAVSFRMATDGNRGLITGYPATEARAEASQEITSTVPPSAEEDETISNVTDITDIVSRWDMDDDRLAQISRAPVTNRFSVNSNFRSFNTEFSTIRKVRVF